MKKDKKNDLEMILNQWIGLYRKKDVKDYKKILKKNLDEYEPTLNELAFYEDVHEYE